MKRSHISGVVICLLTFYLSLACAQNQSIENDYWYNSPDGEKIEFETVNELMWVEFAEATPDHKKSDVITTYKNSTTSSVIIPKNWKMSDEVMPLAAQLSATEKKTLRKNKPEILGMLPRLRNKATGKVADFRPATFDIVFSQEIHETELQAFLKRYGLKLRSDSEKNFNSYYVDRFVHVEIPKGAALFPLIREIREQPEVLYAFPLKRAGRNRIYNQMNMLSRFSKRGETPEMDKVYQVCREIYYLYHNNSPKIFQQYVKNSSIKLPSPGELEVQISAKENSPTLKQRLQGLGFKLHGSYNVRTYHVYSGVLPIKTIRECARIDEIIAIERPTYINADTFQDNHTESQHTLKQDSHAKSNQTSSGTITEGLNSNWSTALA